MDIRLSKISRELLVKIPQSASKWMSIFKKKVREWLVKMAQNAPKWIFVFQKFPGGDTPGPPASVGTQTSFKRTPPTGNPGYGPGTSPLENI